MIEVPELTMQQEQQTDDFPSFDEYWMASLEELGFRQNEYGEIVFGDENLHTPQQETNEEGEEQSRRATFDPALYRTIVAGMVDRVLETYGEVAKDKALRDAVVAFLAAQPPQNLNDASVRLLVLAGLGLKFLRQREYEEQYRRRQVQKDPKSTLDPSFRSSAERLAKQLGIDPDELIMEYLQEWHRSKEVGNERSIR
ncbi:MAG: hypothetical protein QXM12_06590 [Nitrososphaerota archaeon]